MANPQQKTTFAFDYFHPNSYNLNYQGEAHVPSGASYLRLTKTGSYSVGRVLYSAPLQFWEQGKQAAFETTITFFITPPATGVVADGIAFFIAPVNSSVGADGASLGIFNESGKASRVFAVEFDTYPNTAWEPNYPHIGINLESRTSANVTRFDGAYNKQVTAHIRYSPTTRRISVVATTDTDTFTVEHYFDLKTILPQQVQVGISAATGEHSSIQDVFSWNFTSSLLNDTAK